MMTDEEYNKLYKAFEDECDEIAQQCEAEGYPANGTNYELRVEALMEEYPYKELFEEDDEDLYDYEDLYEDWE